MTHDKQKRYDHMLEAISQLTREALAAQIEAVESAAADAAGDEEDEKPVVAKIGLAISWAAGEPVPEITVKASYSIRRSCEVSGLADGDQSKLPFGEDALKAGKN
jgi:hypothetical protein